jgi:hypothetical protein
VQPPTISVKKAMSPAPKSYPAVVENITDRATRVFHTEQLIADGGESDAARHWRLSATSQFSSLGMIIDAYRASRGASLPHRKKVVHPYLTVSKL